MRSLLYSYDVCCGRKRLAGKDASSFITSFRCQVCQVASKISLHIIRQKKCWVKFIANHTCFDFNIHNKILCGCLLFLWWMTTLNKRMYMVCAQFISLMWLASYSRLYIFIKILELVRSAEWGEVNLKIMNLQLELILIWLALVLKTACKSK